MSRILTSENFGKEGRTCSFQGRGFVVGVESYLRRVGSQRHAKLERPGRSPQLTFPTVVRRPRSAFPLRYEFLLIFSPKIPQNKFYCFPEIINSLEWHLMNSHCLTLSAYIYIVDSYEEIEFNLMCWFIHFNKVIFFLAMFLGE